MNELYTALIAGAITIIGALVTYVVNNIKNKQIRERIATLEDFIASDDTEYYIVCPNCNQKIVLNKIKILVNKESNK